MAIYTSKATQPPGRTVIAYIFRDSDSQIYRTSSSDFIQENLANLSGDARIPYRVTFTERSPGSYHFNLDVTNFQDGSYTLEGREIANNVEYDNIIIDQFTVVNGEVVSTDIYVKITTAPARTLFAYIYSAHTSKYYSPLTKSMGGLDIVRSSLEERSSFRHSYFEEKPTEYVLSVEASSIPDGTYYIATYELVDNMEIEAGEKSLIRIQDGKQQIGVDFDKVLVTHDTGGKDNLRYVEANGSPVGGATVTIYIANEYRQENYSNPLGKTLTGPDGRWEEPLSVDPGTTYTVLFQKSGYFGPDSEEVVI